MYKLGIDLAKNRTGCAVLDDNAIVVKTSGDKLLGIANLWDNNMLTMISKCTLLAKKIDNFINGCEVSVFVELGNYGNAKMTCDFALLCGVLISCLEKVCHVNTIKIFNANEWYKNIGKLSDCRELRKQTSLEHATDNIEWKQDSENCDYCYEDYVDNYGEIDDNMADAINIAYFGDKCESFTSQRVSTVKKKKMAKNTLKMKNKVLKKIISLQNKLNQAKTQKTKDKINNMIKELEASNE